jgi:hypothetical protein
MPERRGESARGWVFTTAKFGVFANENPGFPGKFAGRPTQNSQNTFPVSKVGLALAYRAARPGAELDAVLLEKLFCKTGLAFWQDFRNLSEPVWKRA